MFFLGALSVLQLTTLPGLLLIRLFPGRRSWIQQAASVFVLSLLANYLVVLVLVAIGFYLRSVVLAVFIAEIAALLWLHRASLLTSRQISLQKIKARVVGAFKDLSAWMAKDFWSALLYLIFSALAILALVYLLGIWVQNFDTVYQTWDSWASWDRWAERWAENSFPLDTWEYPQMIPVLLSISYKFIGTIAVKFFGKSIMPLFALLIVLLLVDLGRRYRSYGYILGAVLAFYSINYFLAKYYAEVYVDIPVAALSLFVVCILLMARDERNKQALNSQLLFGALVSATAAVTKQTGLYIMVFYPLFCYFWVLRPKRVPFAETFRLVARNFLLTLAIVVPWYAFIEYNILTGQSTSNIEYVINDIYDGQSYFERFMAAIQSLRGYAYWFVFLGISLLVLPRELQQLAILVIFPFSILWAVFLSYEHRNLAVVFPLLSMTVGVAAQSWLERFNHFLRARKPKLAMPLIVLLLIPLAIVGLNSIAVSSEDLIVRQITEQRKIFEPTLNQKLYTYFARTGGPQPVITDYPIGWLPDLNGIWLSERFESMASLQQWLDQGAANLMLIPVDGVDQEILDFVQQQLDEGTYELIFTEANYRLIYINSRQ